jgi:hypothetical protein
MNALIEHKNVLLIAQQVISGALDPGAGGEGIRDEEAKRSSQTDGMQIPMQTIQGNGEEDGDAV